MAVQLTVVVPIGNVVPDAGVQTTVGLGSVVSVAVTVNVTTAPLESVASAIIFEGKFRTGAVVSRTVTVNEPVEELGGVA